MWPTYFKYAKHFVERRKVKIDFNHIDPADKGQKPRLGVENPISSFKIISG